MCFNLISVKMFIKLSVILFLLEIAFAQNGNQTWDLAVAINHQVEFLNSNGSLLGAAVPQFSKLKALTFDSVRHQFMVSDMDQDNDTIYSVHLTKETDITPVVQDLPDDIQGLAIDPITDTLFWTDTVNRTINYVSLQDPLHLSKVLLEFKDGSPQDIAIDVCRRYIYWTNSEMENPTIERAKLDGQSREIIVRDDLFMPSGIAIDQELQRIYWADLREGIYFRIESTKFDGTERQILHEGTHQKPYAIAIDKEAVYWTDTNNNALWRKRKEQEEVPEKLRNFDEKPTGLVARNENYLNPECHKIITAINTYNDTGTEYYEISTTRNELNDCLNNGELTKQGCKCRRGFTGARCEISLCYNYCLHGNCHLSSMSYPQCHCPKGYSGSRCEKHLCDGFCLNGGKCNILNNSTRFPSCSCPKPFIGQRCEQSLNPQELCKSFCATGKSDILSDQKNTFICRCEGGAYEVMQQAERENFTYAYLTEGESEPSLTGYFKDPVFIILSACMLLMLLFIIALAVVVQRQCRQPRIKKKFIVNKNVTPLTFRPQTPSPQCEITIENCCNMNICETPCFEPPQLRTFQVSAKDEKRMLLANMENNSEDLY